MIKYGYRKGGTIGRPITDCSLFREQELCETHNQHEFNRLLQTVQHFSKSMMSQWYPLPELHGELADIRT